MFELAVGVGCGFKVLTSCSEKISYLWKIDKESPRYERAVVVSVKHCDRPTLASAFRSNDPTVHEAIARSHTLHIVISVGKQVDRVEEIPGESD